MHFLFSQKKNKIQIKNKYLGKSFCKSFSVYRTKSCDTGKKPGFFSRTGDLPLMEKPGFSAAHLPDYNAFRGGSSVRKLELELKRKLEPESGYSVTDRFRCKSKFKFTDSPKSFTISHLFFKRYSVL